VVDLKGFRLVNQHNGDVILDGVNQAISPANQARFVRAHVQTPFASRAHEDIEQFVVHLIYLEH